MSLPTLKSMWNGIRRLAKDEQGAEGLEKLLIVAAVVIPLLGVLIWFRGTLRDWLVSQWGEVESDENTVYDSNESGAN